MAVRFGNGARARSTASTQVPIPRASLKAGMTTAKLGSRTCAMAASISSVTKVLVIGAAGLLGREVVIQAQARGDDVLRAGRLTRPGWLRFDARRDDPAELLAQAEGEFVVNCAGVLASEIDEHANVAAAEAVNAQFPHALAAAAETLGARLVHISTDAVF